MTAPIYEIVEIDEGEYALQRTDTEEEPVVIVRFSAQAMEFLNSAQGEIAKTMIEAGIQRVENIVEDFEMGRESSERTLH